MSERATRVRAVPLSRLFVQAEPEGPPPEDLRADELEAACAAVRAEVEGQLLPRIEQLQADLSAERAARTAEGAERARIADAALAALQQTLSDAVAGLALAVAGQVLAAEPQLGAQTLAALVAQALAQAPEGDSGTVRLHPLHVSAAPSPPPGWRLLADPELAPGTVIAEVGPCLSLASIDLRLAQAADALEARP
jgi:flagellar biosynthesis/type III secretory pathway protein FliH